MSALARLETALKPLECGSCGVWHAIPQAMFDSCLREGGFWSCPNGHRRGYGEGTEAKRIKALEQELAAERTRRDAALARANEAATAASKSESALRRHKTRTKNGVCPCCSRTFKQLAAHMKNKHPEYAP